MTNQDIRVERTPRSDDTDETVNAGRREAHIAGGNGEQASRRHARLKSERRSDHGPVPFRRTTEASEEPSRHGEGVDPERNAERAIRASGREAPSTTGARR